MIEKKPFLRLPIVSHGAEFLIIGHLMRRNILAYKAPPNNEGYDLICIHPDPRNVTKQIRIQVKSRYQTDCDRGFPVKEKSFESFDYLIVAFLNIGYFFSKHKAGNSSILGRRDAEFYTFPIKFIRENHIKEVSGWEKIRTRNLSIENSKNELGFELSAKKLKINYPPK
jgi:hypothetical protein